MHKKLIIPQDIYKTWILLYYGKYIHTYTKITNTKFVTKISISYFETQSKSTNSKMTSNTIPNSNLNNLVHTATKSASNVLERLYSYKNFTLNAKQSSFKLPEPTKDDTIQSDIASKHLRDEGFTDGMC